MEKLNIRELCPELNIIVKETPLTVENCLKSLKDWLRKSTNLKFRSDDQFLLSFLRHCSYSLEETKQKLQNFYSMRNNAPELMSSRDPTDEKINKIIELGFQLVLPKTANPEAQRVLLVRAGCYDPGLYAIQDLLKVVVMVLDILIKEDDNFVIGGHSVIVDLTNVTVSHFMQYSISLIRNFTRIAHSAPSCQKNIHFINAPYGFEKLSGVFQNFSNSKIFVHGINSDTIYQHFPKKIVPKEYSGGGESMEKIINDWKTKFIENREYLLEDEKFGFNTTKKTEIIKNGHEVHGSFRKLEVD